MLTLTQPLSSDNCGPDTDCHDPIRVLLADDHEILRDGIAHLIHDQPDMEVVGEASDGAMAVELTRRLRPDVVVMDITMPRLTGIEATRVIHGELPVVRIIGLSMHVAEDVEEALRSAGAVAYLSKGCPSHRLVETIREACR